MEDAIAQMRNIAIGPFRVCDSRDYLVVVNVREWRVICHVWKPGVESAAVAAAEDGERAEIVFGMKRNKWSPHGGPIARQTVLGIEPNHVYEFITSIEKEDSIMFKCDGFIYGQVEITDSGHYRANPGDAVYDTLSEAGDAILRQFTRAKNLDA